MDDQYEPIVFSRLNVKVFRPKSKKESLQSNSNQKQTMPLTDWLQTSEKDDIVLYSNRARLFSSQNFQLHNRGNGEAKILQNKQTSQLRVFMRREYDQRICLSHALTPGSEYKAVGEKSLRFEADDFSGKIPKLGHFYLRFKNHEDANDFKAAIDDALANIAPKMNDTDISYTCDKNHVTNQTTHQINLSCDTVNENASPKHSTQVQFAPSESNFDSLPLPSIKLDEEVETDNFSTHDWLKTSEDDDIVLYSNRASLFSSQNFQLHSRGIGDVKILQNTQSNQLRVEYNQSICLSHELTADIEYKAEGARSWQFVAEEIPELGHFCLHFKTGKEANDFKAAVDDALANVAPKMNDNITGHDFDSSMTTGEGETPEMSDTPPTQMIANTLTSSVKSEVNDIEPIQLNSAKTEIGVENGITLFESRSILLHYGEEAWKGGVIGIMKIIVDKDEPKKVQLLMGDTEICCNQMLSKGTKFNKLQETETSLEWFGHDYSGCEVQEKRLGIRFKSVEVCKQFHDTILAAQAKMTDSSSELTKTVSLQSESNQSPEEEELGDRIKPEVESPETSCVVNQATHQMNLSCKTANGNASPEQSTQAQHSPSESSSGSFFSVEQDEKVGTDHFSANDWLKASERDDIVLYSNRARLSCLQDPKIDDLGVVEILQNEQTNQIRVLMKNQQDQKICLNHELTAGIEYKAKSSKSWQFEANDFSEEVPKLGHFSLQFKTYEEAKDFKAAVDDALAIVAPKMNDKDFSYTCDTNHVTNQTTHQINLSCETTNENASPEQSTQAQHSPSESSSGSFFSVGQDEEVGTDNFSTIDWLRASEKDDIALCSNRARLSCLQDSKINDLGFVKILQSEQTNQIRVLMKNQQDQKICLSHALTPGIEYKAEGAKSWQFEAEDFSEEIPKLGHFCLHFKNDEEANGFKIAVDDVLAPE